MTATWMTMKYEFIPLGSMTTKHIQNCVKYIQSGRMPPIICDGMTEKEWLLVFCAELTRRSRIA